MRILPGLLFLLWSFSALAADPGAEDNDRHFRAAALEVDVPVELTQAIARVESGGSPYALNIAGRGYFFKTREDALAAAKQAEAAGLSFDSGIMQINNWWLKRYDLPLEAMFEPAANVLLGSWILKQELNRAGDTWEAVARYHSPNADRGQHYADLVRQALEQGPVTRRTTASSTGREKQKEQPAQTAAAVSQESPVVQSVTHRGQATENTRQVFDRSAGTVRSAADAPLLVYRRTAFTRVPPPEYQEDETALFDELADDSHPDFVQRMR